jgi:hypothetical protein
VISYSSNNDFTGFTPVPKSTIFRAGNEVRGAAKRNGRCRWGTGIMMSSTERAAHCERMASLAEEPEARRRFMELAQLWRGLLPDDTVGADHWLQALGRPDVG